MYLNPGLLLVAATKVEKFGELAIGGGWRKMGIFFAKNRMKMCT